MLSFLLVCLSLLLLSTVSAGEQTIKTLEIHTADDLVTFSNNVNSGSNYSGTTVLLTSDIYFDEGTSNQFYPIGNTSANFFGGTFDGQGYTINNLKITQGSNYAFGLFSYSEGGIFKNVVLGSSCEVICQVNNIVFLSSIMGYCSSSDDTSCSVSNSVSMASVSFNGTNYGPPLHIGGIAGKGREIKNCANYGTIAFSGSTSMYTSIGGIVSYSSKSDITNCINYGTLFHNGTSSTLYLGGITGYSNSEVTITNCVSMGQIITSGTVSKNSYVGSIAGDMTSVTIVSNCYWDDNAYFNYSENQKIIFTNVSSFNTNTLELNESVTAGEYTGKSLISAINGFARADNELSLWVSNTNEKSVSFFINNRTAPLLITSKKLILFPDISNNKFYGWFTDKCLRNSFNEDSISSGITTFYGKYCDFTPEEGCDSSSSSSSNRLSSTTSLSSSNSISSSMLLSSSSSSNSVFTSEYVEIIFGNKDLTEEEVIEIIKEFTDDNNFIIIEFKDDDDGLKVIIKFNDVETAMNFFERINAVSNTPDFDIRRIIFITDNTKPSSSVPLTPFALFVFVLFIFF